MIIIIATVFLLGSFICYAFVSAGAKADIQSQRYWEEHKNELHGQNKHNKQNS